MKVSAAVRELEVEYADRVKFVIVSPEDTAAVPEEIKAFGFEADRHGLVVFDGEGKVAGKLPGHNYGREEIEAQLKTVLWFVLDTEPRKYRAAHVPVSEPHQNGEKRKPR